MTTTPASIADVLPEPADGTRLVRIDFDGTPAVIWRDDDAYGISKHEDERWLDEPTADPMGWREITKHAVAVYAISEKPLAEVDA